MPHQPRHIISSRLTQGHRAGFDRNGNRYSLLQYVLRETEQLHAKLRRYTSPDEHPFSDDLPPLVCESLRA